MMTLLALGIGLLCAAMVGLLQMSPVMLTDIGPYDALRSRMLRLAQIAFIALPLLTLLYEGLMAHAPRDGHVARWGRTAMLCGTIGLPSLLATAGLIHVELKYFLPLPAIAMFAGTLSGACLARRYGRPLERWGWLLITSGMAAGLLMGLYAFDGPLPSPAFIGAYNDLVRRVIRQAHAFAIVVGFLSILLARQQARMGGRAPMRSGR